MANKICWSLDKRQACEKMYHTLPMVKIYLSHALLTRSFTHCSGHIHKWVSVSNIIEAFSGLMKIYTCLRRGICFVFVLNDMWMIYTYALK